MCPAHICYHVTQVIAEIYTKVTITRGIRATLSYDSGKFRDELLNMNASSSRPSGRLRCFRALVLGVTAFLMVQLVSLYLSWSKQIVLDCLSPRVNSSPHRTCETWGPVIKGEKDQPYEISGIVNSNSQQPSPLATSEFPREEKHLFQSEGRSNE